MTWSEIDDNYMRYLKHFLHPMQARVLGEAPKALTKEVQRNTKYSGTDGERELNHGGREEPLTLCEGRNPVAHGESAGVLEHSRHDHDFARDGLVAVDGVRDGNRGHRRDA